MVDRWVIALGVSAFVALVATPLCARRRSTTRRRSWLTSSAGIAMGVAVLLPFLGSADASLVVGVLGALSLWTVGALIDRGRLPAPAGPYALAAAGIAVVGTGLRLKITGVGAEDFIATVAVVVGAGSAWRSALTRDGLLTCSAAAIAAAAGLLGYLAGQQAVTAVSAGVVGASLGFLAYWLPPTAARLRAGGSMLLGFLVVVLALDAKPVLGTPRDAAIPLVLLALPMLDTLLVQAARLRGRRLDPSSVGLAGRLRTLGLSRGGTSALLIALQVALGVVAVFAGRGVLQLGLAGVVTGLTVIGTTIAVGGVRLPGRAGRWPARVLLAVAGLVLALIAMSIPSALALLHARRMVSSAATSARKGLEAANRGDSSGAEVAFLRAEEQFVVAQRSLSGPLVSAGLVVPVLAPNVRAARDVISIGLELSSAGERLAGKADVRRLHIRDGTVPLGELARIEPQLDGASRELRRADAQLRAVARPLLVAPVENVINKLQVKLSKAVHDSRVATEAARLAPAIFGGDKPRHYFLAVQNNAEARATGGFIGNWAVVTAVNGKLTIGGFEDVSALNPKPLESRKLYAPADYIARYARFEPQRHWQDVNLSPDLPTVGSVIAGLLPQSHIAPVDGVVTVDPIGLSDILRLTGPVRVAGWPGPITANNVADITLRQAYAVFANDSARRDAFLGDVADAVWHALSRGDLGSPDRVLRQLGHAAHDKHLAVWTVSAEAQRLVHDAQADAAVPRPQSDLSLVTTQSAGQNKLDVYVHRDVRYEIHIVPSKDAREAVAQASIEVKLRNAAPSAGLPREVLGPNIAGIGPGVERSFVTVYSPLRFVGATLDGTSVGLDTQRELGYWAGSTYLDIQPQSERTLQVTATGVLRLGPGGEYQLRLQRQGLQAPDAVRVLLDVPPGWRIVDAHGLTVPGHGRRAVFASSPGGDVVLKARVQSNPGGSLWGRLKSGG